MSAAAEGGARRGPGLADERTPPGTARPSGADPEDRPHPPGVDATSEAVDLGAASLPEPPRSRGGRWGSRRADDDHRRPQAPAAVPGSPGVPSATGRSLHGDRSGGPGGLIVLTALAGLVAAAAAGLLAGAEPSALVAGAGLGLVVGIGAGLAGLALVRHRAPVEEEPAPATTAAAPGPGPSVLMSRHGDGPTTGRSAGGPTAETAGLDVGPMLASIGHRYQVLSDRQLAALAAIERGRVGQPGPDAGASGGADGLAQANRLARRMRRLAKTLQVLADDPASWEAAAPATMAEILEAAVADNGEPDRVDGASLPTASVDGEAVPDVVHLLAELIDNALAASSDSRSRVAVLGRRSADGYVLSVVDEGSGMAERQREEANTQLHGAPVLGQPSPSSLGLATVSRLAARHGIAVTLLEAPTDGVIAKVRLPARLLGGAPATARVADVADAAGPVGSALPADGGRGPAGPARPAGLRNGERRSGEDVGRGHGGGAGGGGSGRATATADADPGDAGPEGGGGTQPLVSAAEARADLARRVQRSRSVPREVVAPRREQRPAGPAGRADRPAADAEEAAPEGEGDGGPR